MTTQPPPPPRNLSVNWGQCKGTPVNVWCSLENLNLEGLGNQAGVYVIWHGGNPARTVRVGQGAPIKDRLSAHRNDKEILAYKTSGALYVTWAEVPAAYRDGVERYLADLLDPLVGDAFPDVRQIAVNSPW